MESNELKKLISKTLDDADLTVEEIPEVDLYMDQIISLVEAKMSGNKRNSDDKLLTKTMINNYSKEGLIFPAKGKKYTIEHILQMLMILSMKNILSLNDIKTIMQQVVNMEDYHEETLKACYEKYLQLKQHAKGSVELVINSVIDVHDLKQERKEDLLLLLLCFTSMADEMKRVTEKIIDTYFVEENDE